MNLILASDFNHNIELNTHIVPAGKMKGALKWSIDSDIKLFNSKRKPQNSVFVAQIKIIQIPI